MNAYETKRAAHNLLWQLAFDHYHTVRMDLDHCRESGDDPARTAELEAEFAVCAEMFRLAKAAVVPAAAAILDLSQKKG